MISDSDQTVQQQSLSTTENIQWMDVDIPALSPINTTAHVLDLEELTDDPPAQNSSTENQPLVTDMLACSRDQCGFKTKLKRCLDLHIKGNKSIWDININFRVSVQGVKSLRGHFACLCQGLIIIK